MVESRRIMNYLHKKFLDNILNKRVSSAHRAGSMVCLGFGETIEYMNFLDKPVKSNEWILHIQTTWRIISNNEFKIVVSDFDKYEVNSSTKWTENFNWDLIGNNLFDEKIDIWLKNNANIFVVDCEVNKLGDLTISFSNSDILQIFVDNSYGREAWRLFEPNMKSGHFVCFGETIEFE